jgi:lipoprotein-releasing system ATP-binding protein
MNNSYVLQCNNIYKSFGKGNNKVNILMDINLKVQSGQTVSVMGSSGSGKSTLLHILASLTHADHGKILLNNQNIESLTAKQLCVLRNSYFGFVYQFHHLLPEFTALENVLMPLLIRGKITLAEKNYARELLSLMGVTDRDHCFPSQLSGGQRQRVAIARAIINKPQIIFADEPTGNLDNQNSHQVIQLFLKLQQTLNTSVIMVTHNQEIAKMTHIRYQLHQGKLITI